MLNSKKIVALLVILLLIIGICTQVYASGYIDLENIINTNSLGANTTTNEVTANETLTNAMIANQIAENQIIANQITANLTANQNSVIQPTTNTSSGNNLPQTGVTEDITVMFFIIVCVVLAIYAYKKIRDYQSL